MKKLFFVFALLLGSLGYAQAQNGVVYEYVQMSTVESVVPGGLGRSRLITTTTEGQLQEKELENFFSLTGINFKNIRNNDNVIANRINELSVEGWELYQITSGTYSAENSTGLFITRYLFRRPVKK
ncbi:MAG: hypothetical protein LW884_00065 [Bacteroidetes bacterium]|jgi:hypothetical protein|nr:hypothetical protein [Bacteroidota bacterium]